MTLMKAQIQRALDSFPFSQIGFVTLTHPLSLHFYEDWLDQGLNADMKYLKDHLDQKRDLNQFLAHAKSSIVITLDYFDHPEPLNLSSMKIASYAKGQDYHYFFNKHLHEACLRLQELYPQEHFKISTDSKPILERDFAYQAGLGWFGKNTCLIHQKKGSYFLIGEIVTTLDFNHDTETAPHTAPSSPLPTLTSPQNAENNPYHPDRCGSCTRCIDACPTHALSPQKLDANKCISYWTIESKTIPPLSLAKKFQEWFFGCDICQDVCPWNIKLHSLAKIEKKNETHRDQILKEILDILNSSNKSLEKKYFGTPLSRARGFGLKRNALIVAMNMKAIEIIEDLKKIDCKNEALQNLLLTVIEEIEFK